MNGSFKDDLAEFNYQVILASEKCGYKENKVSKTQGFMVALALADRRFAEGGEKATVDELRAPLDKDQIAAIKRFRDERGL
ncbi:MAG: hypothetical protein RSP_04840 [Rhodanobacter sp.]